MVWHRGKCAGGLSRGVRRAKGRPGREAEERSGASREYPASKAGPTKTNPAAGRGSRRQEIGKTQIAGRCWLNLAEETHPWILSYEPLEEEGHAHCARFLNRQISK